MAKAVFQMALPLTFELISEERAKFPVGPNLPLHLPEATSAVLEWVTNDGEVMSIQLTGIAGKFTHREATEEELRRVEAVEAAMTKT